VACDYIALSWRGQRTIAILSRSVEARVTDDELIEAADRNMVGAFASLVPNLGHPAGGVESFGGVTAVATGLPVPFYNPVLVLSHAATGEYLRAAVEWVRAKGLPAAVLVREDIDGFVEAVCGELGLTADPWRSPAMVLDPIPDLPAPPAGLELRRVHDEASLADWHLALSSSENLRRAFPRSVLGSGSTALVTGYVDGAPVSAAAAIRTDEVVGIYAVGTLEPFRGRGLGTALTWAAVAMGREWGCRLAVLQASEMGFGVYQRMGFRTVGRYVEYEPAGPDAKD
jgi:GNAT superfamily N-acetyltransferase